MTKKVCVFLADGFEEIEGLTVVDLLRRAEVEVATVSIQETLSVHGAHGIQVQADVMCDEYRYQDADMIVLPGGMPGTLHLRDHAVVKNVISQFDEAKKYIGAICAAPTVLGGAGLLKGRKAVCYPGMEDGLVGAEVLKENVVVDGHIITSRGLGTAIDFALQLIALLSGEEKAAEIETAIVYHA